MAPNPELRYPSAREFGADLEAFRAGTPVAAESEDLDAARRTFRPNEDAAGQDPDATRRSGMAGAPSDATRQTNDGKQGTDGGREGTPDAPQETRLGTVSSIPYSITMRVLLFLLLGGVRGDVESGSRPYGARDTAATQF